jgi:hypothetical protein
MLSVKTLTWITAQQALAQLNKLKTKARRVTRFSPGFCYVLGMRIFIDTIALIAISVMAVLIYRYKVKIKSLYRVVAQLSNANIRMYMKLDETLQEK